MDACQDADAIKQDHYSGKPNLATLDLLRAPALGCADNSLAGTWRQGGTPARSHARFSAPSGSLLLEADAIHADLQFGCGPKSEVNENKKAAKWAIHPLLRQARLFARAGT